MLLRMQVNQSTGGVCDGRIRHRAVELVSAGYAILLVIAIAAGVETRPHQSQWLAQPFQAIFLYAGSIEMNLYAH